MWGKTPLARRAHVLPGWPVAAVVPAACWSMLVFVRATSVGCARTHLPDIYRRVPLPDGAVGTRPAENQLAASLTPSALPASALTSTSPDTLPSAFPNATPS